MDDTQARSFNRRINALEAAMQEVQYVLKLSPLLPGLESTHSSDPIIESTPEVPRGEIFANPFVAHEDPEATPATPLDPQSIGRAICAYCEGDNPPDANKCMWCGKSMLPFASAPLPTRKVETAHQQIAPDVTPKVRVVRHEAASYRPGLRVTITPAQDPSSPQVRSQEARQPFSTTIIHFAENWLQKIGIVIFLFGVAFLFKYSIDQGWLNEQVRVGLGLLFGAVLMVAGLHLHGKRRHFSQVLLGGSIATYYITGYAAYNIFPGLNVPYEVAFGFMSFVTLAAFALSIHQDEAILSVIGVTGGLITPFVLNRADVALPGIVAYSCLVITGASGIYLMRGWRSLLWTCLQGGWSMLLLGYVQHILHFAWSGPGPALSDRWTLQAGVAVMAVAFWALPVLREVLFARNPARWSRPDAPQFFFPEVRTLIGRHVHLLTVATPIMVLAYSTSLWAGLWEGMVQREVWGTVMLGGAALFVITCFLVRRYAPSLTTLAYTHAIVAIGLLTAGLAYLMEGNALLIALAVEAAALHLLARRTDDKGIATCGNLIFGAVGIWLAQRLLPGMEQYPALRNPQALTDLAVMVIALAASFAPRQQVTVLTIRGLVHLAVLAWFWRELHSFANGDGYVMLAWAAYGLLLHLIARRTRDALISLGTSIAAHLAFEGALALLALRLASGRQGDIMFNGQAVIDLGMMALALAASFAVKSGKAGSSLIATIYRLAVHAAVMGWLWREATSLDLSSGYVMLRWAAYLAMVAYISYRVGDRITLNFISGTFLGVAYLFARSIFSPREGDLAILNARTMLDLAVLGLALATSFLAQPREVRIAFRMAIHAAVLGLLWRELFTLGMGVDPSSQPFYITGSGYMMLAWAHYLSALHLLAVRTKDAATSLFAHTGFVAVAGILAWRLTTPSDMTLAILNQKALIDLAVIALVALVSFVARPKEIGMIYRYCVHAAVLGLFVRELYWLNEGLSYIMFVWAAYALLLYAGSILVKQARNEWMDLMAHAIFAASGLLLLARVLLGLILVNADQFAVLNPKGLSYLGIILAGGAMYAIVRRWGDRVSMSEWQQPITFAYALWLHFAFLGWTWQELGLIPHGGNGYVTIAWGMYAVALVAVGLRLGRNLPLLTAGITTLFAVAAKLFLIDLQYLDPIWRILLFLGFGGFFLLFSYFFQGAIRPGGGRQVADKA